MKIKLLKDCNLVNHIGRKDDIYDFKNDFAQKLIRLNIAEVYTEEEPQEPQEEVVLESVTEQTEEIVEPVKEVAPKIEKVIKKAKRK